MKNKFTERDSSNEKKSDFLFIGIAVLFLILMIVCLVRYGNYRSKNNAMNGDYSAVTENLIRVRQEKSSLEKELETAKQELADLNKKIAALSGN